MKQCLPHRWATVPVEEGALSHDKPKRHKKLASSSAPAAEEAVAEAPAETPAAAEAATEPPAEGEATDES